MSSSAPIRIRALGVLIFCGALLVGARLYFLHVVEAKELSARGERQYMISGGGLFNRGGIFFTTKNGERVSAASLKEGFALEVEIQKAGSAEALYERLAPYATLARTEFTAALQSSAQFVVIAHRLSQDAAETIGALALPGVHLVRERWRFYPGGERAAHALGFVGSDGDRLDGRYGLERYYEDTLARTSTSPYRNFFAELIGLVRTGDTLGGDVVTSIEPTVQEYLEQTITKIGEKLASKETAGIVMDPKTGEIFALAARPAFDPNSFQKEKNWRVFVNPLVENVYEFGSIVKPITMAAGIDAGAVTPTTTYRDEGSLTLDGKTIYNFDKKGRGNGVPMQEVLNQSLNTGAAFVALTMGTQKFANYLLNFGVGSETGIDLPNEASPLVDNLKSPRQIEYATASFGQGVATTPIAMARALAALANKGELPNPHLAAKISYDIGGFSRPSFGESRKVIAPETADTITNMLVKVVDTALLGGSLKLDRWSVAAKTGTAQIAKPGGGYYDDRYLHSFFGYFPAYAPRFLVFLYTAEPHGVSFASHTLTAPFFDIAKFLLNYYAIPPDR